MEIQKELEKLCKKGNVRIPKPESENDFTIKGFGNRRGENALVYHIPSHTENKPFYEKGVTFSEVQKAYDELQRTGCFTKQWFKENLSDCNGEGGCNFTTIGGIFELLGIAKYERRGVYKKL